MNHHLHHVHLFASDVEKSLSFYKKYFGGTIVLDMEVAGARNIFMRVGTGRIHFYNQPPRVSGAGSIHHFGIQTHDIEGDYRRLKAEGVGFKKEITDLGYMKYIMVPAPDSVLIELFEVKREALPAEYLDYFCW